MVFTVTVLIVSVLAACVQSLHRDVVLKSFKQGNAFKVIAGLHNFDHNLVKNIAWAATEGGATHIDIACDPELVKLAKSISSIPVCVSAVDPNLFVHAVRAGADMIEIGNFDGFYDQGINFTADDVIKMTKDTRALLPDTPLSVTIPHTLSLSEQITLARCLEDCGADIIQTEGKMSANLAGLGVQEMIELAAPTIASAYALSRAVTIPVMCASGLSDVTAPLAIAAGARGVGVGSMINKLPNRQQMLLAVAAISHSIGRSSSNTGSTADEKMKLQMEVPQQLITTATSVAPNNMLDC